MIVLSALEIALFKHAAHFNEKLSAIEKNNCILFVENQKKKQIKMLHLYSNGSDDTIQLFLPSPFQNINQFMSLIGVRSIHRVNGVLHGLSHIKFNEK